MRFIARLVGIRLVESPDAVRVTIPRWLAKLFPGIPEGVAKNLQRDEHLTEVRVVKRSVIAKIR